MSHYCACSHSSDRSRKQGKIALRDTTGQTPGCSIRYRAQKSENEASAVVSTRCFKANSTFYQFLSFFVGLEAEGSCFIPIAVYVVVSGVSIKFCTDGAGQIVSFMAFRQECLVSSLLNAFCSENEH